MCLHHEKTHYRRRVWLAEDLVFTREDFLGQQVVARGFGHFFAVKGQHIGMHPVAHRTFVVTGFRLGNFAFVMREFKVHAPAVDVKGLSQIFCTHYSTLQMPPREPLSPGRGPPHDVLGLCPFPERKILGVLFFILSGQFPGVGNHVLEFSAT